MTTVPSSSSSAAAPAATEAPVSPRWAARIEWIRRRKWSVRVSAAVVCAVAWTALGLGIAFEVRFAPLFLLATLAAVSSELLLWLAAPILGRHADGGRHPLVRMLRRALS